MRTSSTYGTGKLAVRLLDRQLNTLDEQKGIDEQFIIHAPQSNDREARLQLARRRIDKAILDIGELFIARSMLIAEYQRKHRMKKGSRRERLRWEPRQIMDEIVYDCETRDGDALLLVKLCNTWRIYENVGVYMTREHAEHVAEFKYKSGSYTDEELAQQADDRMVEDQIEDRFIDEHDKGDKR